MGYCGIDLHAAYSRICILDGAGEVMETSHVRTSRPALTRFFGNKEPVLEQLDLLSGEVEGRNEHLEAMVKDPPSLAAGQIPFWELYCHQASCDFAWLSWWCWRPSTGTRTTGLG